MSKKVESMRFATIHIIPRNWLWETRRQEQERRLKAVEASIQSVHDRVNELDERFGAYLLERGKNGED